jgi:hypothetical protein
MEVLNVEIVNPKAKVLLVNLAELGLIHIKSESALSEMLAKLRRNESEIPSLEEISEEVETVRQARYDKKNKKNQNNY